MLLPHRRSGEKYVWHWVILVGKYIATSLPNSRDKWKRPASTVWEVYGYWGWCRASQTKQTSKTNHCSCLSLGEPIMHGWEEAEHQMEPPDQPELSFPFCASFKKKRSSGTPVSLLPRFLGGSQDNQLKGLSVVNMNQEHCSDPTASRLAPAYAVSISSESASAAESYEIQEYNLPWVGHPQGRAWGCYEGLATSSLWGVSSSQQCTRRSLWSQLRLRCTCTLGGL